MGPKHTKKSGIAIFRGVCFLTSNILEDVTVILRFEDTNTYAKAFQYHYPYNIIYLVLPIIPKNRHTIDDHLEASFTGK